MKHFAKYHGGGKSVEINKGKKKQTFIYTLDILLAKILLETYVYK